MCGPAILAHNPAVDVDISFIGDTGRKDAQNGRAPPALSAAQCWQPADPWVPALPQVPAYCGTLRVRGTRVHPSSLPAFPPQNTRYSPHAHHTSPSTPQHPELAGSQGQEACSRNVNPPSSLGFRVHSPQAGPAGVQGPSRVHLPCPHPPSSLHLPPPPLYLQVCRQEPRTLVGGNGYRARQSSLSTRLFVPQPCKANRPTNRPFSQPWVEDIL